MTKVLVTFPGRAGDLLWALPTVRAISESLGAPVDLLIAGEFASMIPLLDLQPYLARVHADPAWSMNDGWNPPGRADVIRPYARTVHLGYRRWPELPLPFEVYDHCRSTEVGLPLLPLDLDRPWITVEPWRYPEGPVSVGWTDCHFELKAGLMTLLHEHRGFHDEDGTPLYFTVLAPPGSRWVTEFRQPVVSWPEAAQRIAQSHVFLGDCPALHVLAVALGTPVVCYEPMESRLNNIFWPLGKNGRVRLVRGNDGEMTCDSRHTADTLSTVLKEIRCA
jgi:hypothetical protein